MLIMLLMHSATSHTLSSDSRRTDGAVKTGCCTGLTFWLDAQEEVPSISSGMLHLSQPTMTLFMPIRWIFHTNIARVFSNAVLCLQVCSSYNDSNIELKEIYKATFIAQVGTDL